jgi:hypothetical protein
MTFPLWPRVLILLATTATGPVPVTSPPQVRYPYPGRSRVAQSAERPAVNRQVIGSSPIAGAQQFFSLFCAKAADWVVLENRLLEP